MVSESKATTEEVQQISILVQTTYQTELIVSVLYIVVPYIRDCPLFQCTTSLLSDPVTKFLGRNSCSCITNSSSFAVVSLLLPLLCQLSGLDTAA